MEPARLFEIVNFLPLPGWVLLLVLPGWRWTPLFTACILPSILAVIYLALFAANVGSAEGGFGSLEGVKSLFALDAILLAGWIHYLAFDLFVGSWEVRDARRNNIAHTWVVPCLVLTFLVGPVGLLAYWALRSVLVRRQFEGEVPAAASAAG